MGFSFDIALGSSLDFPGIIDICIHYLSQSPLSPFPRVHRSKGSFTRPFIGYFFKVIISIRLYFGGLVPHFSSIYPEVSVGTFQVEYLPVSILDYPIACRVFLVGIFVSNSAFLPYLINY